MCTGAEPAVAASAAEGAKAAGALEAAAAAEAGLALGSGSATAATLGGASGLASGAGALAGGLEAAGALNASYAQPLNAFGVGPQASFTQGALASGNTPAFLSGAAGGTAAGAALDAGSFGYGGPEPTAWDSLKQVGQQASQAWDGLGTVGQKLVGQVASSAIQGMMGDGGEGTRRPTNSYQGAQAVPLRQPGLYGSTGVPGNGDAVAGAMSRAAPVAAATGGAQAAPASPGVSNSGNGAVTLGRSYRQYT